MREVMVVVRDLLLEPHFGQVRTQLVLAVIGIDAQHQRNRHLLAQAAGDRRLSAVGMDHVVAAMVTAQHLLAAIGQRFDVGRLGADAIQASLHGPRGKAPIVLFAVKPFFLNGVNEAGFVADANAGVVAGMHAKDIS